MKIQFGILGLLLALALGVGASTTRAGSATDIYGLYYTGISSSGSLLAGGATDPNWSVVYANVAGNSSVDNTYEGAAYVVSSATNGGPGNYIDYAWVQNTSQAQWITAPNARISSSTSSTANVGGDYLPGNGTSGTNVGIYTYRLAFTIAGTGSGTVTNAVSIGLTIAADDNLQVYVNPTTNSNGSVASGNTASYSRNAAWNNTQTTTLQNGTDGTGTSGNSVFVIGTNYLYVVVTNTNSVTGSSSSTVLNPSGLLVYQVGTAMTIDGRPVPEPATGLMGLAVMAWVGGVFRRRRRPSSPSFPAPRE